MSASERLCSSTTREREMSAELTSKNGFSVVAPTSTMTRSSTACRSESCWLRLKRWISSTNRIVRDPLIARRFSAASISRRRSDTVPPIADTSTNVALVAWAITWASDVLPVPAGPYRMIELKRSCSMAARSQLPGPTASSCPTSSSSVRGRIRTANGATDERACCSISEKRVSMSAWYHTNACLPLKKTETYREIVRSKPRRKTEQVFSPWSFETSGGSFLSPRSFAAASRILYRPG